MGESSLPGKSVARRTALPSTVASQRSSLDDPRYPLRYQVPGPRVNATVLPSAEKLASFASWNGSLVSRPPSTGTEYSSGPPGNDVPRDEAKTTFLPSGVQPT